MTEPESQMKARLTFQKKPHATFSCIFFILEPVRGTTSGCKHIHETTADMVAQHAFSRTVVHVIFDATRKYGNRGLAVGRKSGRGLHDINSKTDIDLRISVKFGPLGWIGLCFTWFL